MMNLARWKVVLVLLATIFGILFTLPNLLPANVRGSLPPFMPKNTLHLGLDLQGGSDLLYSVELIYAVNYRTIPLLIVASIWYLIVTTLLSFGQYYLERYFGRGTARELPQTPLQRLLRTLSIRHGV